VGVDGCSSGVPEQPVGEKETAQGALNRLESLKACLQAAGKLPAASTVAAALGSASGGVSCSAGGAGAAAVHRKDDKKKKDSAASEVVHLVAVENGIVKINRGSAASSLLPWSYLDQPFVASFDVRSGTTRQGTSVAATVDITKYSAFIDESLMSADRSVTFGSILEKQMNFPSGSWHQLLDTHQRNRSLLIEMALESLLNASSLATGYEAF
jgi:hypothetical protein